MPSKKRVTQFGTRLSGTADQEYLTDSAASLSIAPPSSSIASSRAGTRRSDRAARSTYSQRSDREYDATEELASADTDMYPQKKKSGVANSSKSLAQKSGSYLSSRTVGSSSKSKHHSRKIIESDDDEEDDDANYRDSGGAGGGSDDELNAGGSRSRLVLTISKSKLQNPSSHPTGGPASSSAKKITKKRPPSPETADASKSLKKAAASSAGKSHKKSSSKTAAAVVGASSGKRKGESQNADSKYCDDTSEEEDNISLDDDSDSSEDSVHVDERAEEGSDEEIINDADADVGSRYQTDADASLLDDASPAGTDDADNAEAVPATRAEKTAGRGGAKRKGAASAATSARGKGYKAVKFRWLTDEEALKAQSELWVPQFIAEGPIDEDMLTSIDDAVAVESIISKAVKNHDLPPLSLPPSADDLFINKSLVPRALHVYEGLRRFLPIIRLTGFCVEEFCAALACKENNNLLAEIFMSLIRSVVRNAEVNNIWLVAPEERDALNASLCLMDCITWPQVIVRIKNYLGDAEHVDKLSTILSQRTFPCVEPAMLLDVMECLFNKFLTTHQVHEETTNAQDIDELDLQSEDEQLNDAENSADGSKPTDIEGGSAPMRTRAKRKAWKVLPLVSMRSIQEDNCRQCGKQGNLMCCDGCPAAYHQECVGLSDVPAGKWFCDPCNNSYVEGVSDMDLIYSRVRNAHIGCDRSGRRYWFVCSRIVVERQRSDPAIVKMPNDDETLYFYYSTPAQLDELIRLLSVEYEGNLKSFFKEHRSIIADLMQKNLDHTRERLVRQSLQAKKSHLEMLEEQARQRLQAMSPEVEESAVKQAGTDDDDEDEEMKDASQETKALDAEQADAGPSTTPVPGEALAGVVAGPLTRMQTGTITAKSYRPVALPVRLAATHAGGRAAADARRYGRAAGPLSTHTNFKMHDPPTLSGHAMSALASPHYRLGEMGEFRRFVNYYNYDGKGKRVMSPEDRHRLQSFVTRFHLEHVPMNLSGNAMFVGGGAAPINFIWNKPVLGTTASLIEAMKGEIVLMESQIPTFAMHPLWAPYRAEWLKRVKSFRSLLQPQNDDDVTFHELAQLFHRLVLGLRKRCFTKTWNELFGFISCSPVTAAEREETKKLDRRRHREQEDIFHLKRTSLIQVTRTKHAIYKIKGEEYRVTGYGGPCWVRAGRRDVNLFADRPKEDDPNDVERFNVLRGALNDEHCTRNGEKRKNRDWYEKLVADATERQQQNAAAGNKRTASGSSVSPPLTTNQCEDLIAKDFGTLPSFADTSASESMQTDAGLGRPMSAAASAMKIATSPASARLFSITSETSVHPLVNRLLQTRIDAQTFFYDAHAKAVAAASVAATTPSKGSVDMGKENRPAGEETAADTAASAIVPSITAVSLAAKPQFSNAYDRIVMPDHLPPDAYKTFAGPNFARYPNKEAARDAAPLRLRGLPALRASVPVQSIFSSLDVDELNRLIRVGGQVDVDGYKYDIKNSNYWHYLPGPRPLLAAQVRYSISTSTSLPDLFMAFKFVKVCIQFALLHGGVHVPKPGNPITSYIPKPLRIEGTDIDMELDAGHAILSTQAQPAGMRWHYVMEMRQSGKFNPEQYFRTRDLFVPQVKKPSNMIGSFLGNGAAASCGPSQGVGSGRKETKGSRQSERHKTLRRLPPSSITDTTSIDPQQLVEDNRDWVHEASMPLEEIGTTLELLKFPEADLQKAFDNVEKVKMRGEKPAPPVTPTNLQFSTPNSLNVKLDKKGGPTQVTLLLPGGGRQQYSTFGGNGGMIQMHPPSSQQQPTIAGSLNLGPALLQQRVTAGMNRDYLTQTTTSEKLCILGAVKASHTTATERLMYKSTPLQPTSANTSHQTTKLVYMSPVPQPLFERNVREPTISIDTKSAGGPTQIVLCQQRRSGGGAGGSAAQPSSQSINHVSHCFGSTLPNNTALRAMPACMTSSSIQQQSNSNNNAGLIVTQEKKQVLSNSLAMGRRIGDRIRRIAGLACAVGYPGGPNAATPLGVPKSELANSYLQLYEKTGSPSSIIEAALAKDQHLHQRLPKQAAEQIVAKSGSQSPSQFLLEQQEAGPIDIIEPADTDVTSVPKAVDAVAENPVVDESIPAEQVSAEITVAAHIDESVAAPAPNALLVSEITGAVDVTTEAVTAGDEEQQPLTEQPQEIVAEVAPLVEGEEDGETKMNRHYPFKVSAHAHAPTTHRHRTGTVYTVQPPPTTTVFVPQNLLFGSAAEQIQIPPLHQLSTVHGRVEEEKAFLNALLMTTLPPPSAAIATAAPAIATSSTQAQAVVATLSVATTPVVASAAEESSAQLLQKQQQNRNKQLPPPPMPVLLPTPPPPPINPAVSAMQYLQQAAEAVLKTEINRANGDEPVAEAESEPTEPAALSDVAAAAQSDAASSTPAEHPSASTDVADQQVQQQQIGTIASRLSSTADLNATGESQLLQQQADGADIGGTMVLSDADAYNTQLILSSSAGSTPSLVTAYAAPTLPTRGGKRASATTGAGAVGAAAGGRRNARNAIQHPPSSAIGVVDGESAKHGGRYQHLTPKNTTRTAAANAARRERYAAQRASGSGKRSRDAMEAHDQDENDEDENEDREYAGAHDSMALENRLLKSFPPGVVGVVLQPPGAPAGNLMTMNEMLAMSGSGGESGGHNEDMMPSGLDLIAAAALAQQRMSEQPSKSQSAAASSRNSSRPMTGGEDVPDSQKSPTRSPRRRHSQRIDDAAPIAADEASATTRAEPTSPSLAPTATASLSSPQRSRSKLSASPVNIDRAHSSASQRHLQLSAVEDGVDQMLPTASASATDSAVTTGAVGADDANGEEEEGDEEVVEIPYTTEQIEQLVHTTDTCLDRVRAELEVLRGKMNRFREAKKAAENKAKSILNTRKSQSKKTSDLQAQRDKLLDLNEKLQRIEGGLDRRVALEQRCSEFKVICRKILEGQSLFKAELSKMNEYKEFIERATMSEEQKQQQLLEQQLQAQQQHLAQHEHALPPASDNASSSHLSSLADEINARNAMSAMLSTLPEHSGMQDVGAEFLTPSDYMQHQNQQRPISSAAGGDMISAGGTLSELASAHLSPTRSPMPAQTAASDAHRSVSRTEELQKRSKKQNTKSATKSKANVATTSDLTSTGKPKGIRKQKVDSKLEVSGKPSKTAAGSARVGKKSANTLTKKASTQSSASTKKKQHEHHATAAGSSTQPPKHSHSKHGGSGLVPYSSLGKVRKLTEAQKETHNDYKCLCKRNVFENKPSIQCDMCGFWYHISCCKLTDIEAVAMQEWFCKRCCDKSHINCICFEPEEGDTTPFICCDDCKSWYHYRCVGLDSITVNGLDKWFCGLCCDANDEMRRRFVALRVFILRNPVPEADYAATEEMIKEIRASEYMKSHAKPLLSVSLMHSTVKRFNPSADISKLTYDFTILLTDIKERRFGRMVDVIKAAGAVIDTLREILPSPAASEILQQLDAIDAQLMSSLRQTALKCVFDDAAAQQQAGNVSGGAGVSGGDAATASSSGSGGGSSSGSDDENEGGADQMLTTSVAPDATAAANKKSIAGRSKKHQVVGGTQKTNKNDKSSAGGHQKQAAASRKKSAAASAGGTKKVVIGRGGTQRTGKRHHGSLASSTLPIPTVAAPRDDVDYEGLTEDASNKRHRADEEAQIGHPPSPPVLRDAAEADESGHDRAEQQQQEVNDTGNATVAE